MRVTDMNANLATVSLARVCEYVDRRFLIWRTTPNLCVRTLLTSRMHSSLRTTQYGDLPPIDVKPSQYGTEFVVATTHCTKENKCSGRIL